MLEKKLVTDLRLESPGSGSDEMVMGGNESVQFRRGGSMVNDNAKGGVGAYRRVKDCR